jgi:branched-chain amino acid transport system substrate-binding protein
VWKKSLLALAASTLVLSACSSESTDSTATVESPSATEAAETAAETSAPEAYAVTQGITDDEIYIQGFGPITGPASWVGLGNRDGFSLAVDEINANGGIHGRQLRFDFADDEFEVSKAQGVVRKIIDQDKPFLVYSGTGSTVFLSVADQLREAKVPTFNGFSGSEAARQTPEVPNLYHGEAVSTLWVTPSFVEMINVNLKAKRVAIMNEDGEWGKTLCAGLVAELEALPEIEIVTQQTYGAADTDFTGQLIAVRDANPQVVVNCGLFPAAKILLRQANELGIEAVWLGDAGQANATVWAEAGAGAEDWLFNWYQPQYLTDTTGAMAEFRTKYLASYPDAPEGRPAHSDTFSYDAAYIIANALDAAGPDLTADKFLAAMSAVENVNPTAISPNVNCANERNECFIELSWNIVTDGTARAATADDYSRLAAKIA